MSHAERVARLSSDDPLGMTRQRHLPGVGRSAAHRPAGETPERDLELMRRMDALHFERPAHGSRQMVAALRLQGVRAARCGVRRLMRKMGLTAVAPKPVTSVKAPSHKVFSHCCRA